MALLRGFGSYLPERVVGNVEMARLLGIEAEWIREMSGIENRRFAAKDESVAAMAFRAGAAALENAGVEASELGLVIVATGTSERRFPGPASEVQHLLGASQAVALDVPMASAGALFGMVQAALWAPRSGKTAGNAAKAIRRRNLRPLRPASPSVLRTACCLEGKTNIRNHSAYLWGFWTWAPC